MIEPTKKDIGRRVIFADDRPHLTERGTLEAFNTFHAIVRFDRDGKRKFCQFASLTWEQGK